MTRYEREAELARQSWAAAMGFGVGYAAGMRASDAPALVVAAWRRFGSDVLRAVTGERTKG